MYNLFGFSLRGYLSDASIEMYTKLKISEILKCIRSRHGQSVSIISVATGQRLVVKVTLLITFNWKYPWIWSVQITLSYFNFYAIPILNAKNVETFDFHIPDIALLLYVC